MNDRTQATKRPKGTKATGRPIEKWLQYVYSMFKSFAAFMCVSKEFVTLKDLP